MPYTNSVIKNTRPEDRFMDTTVVTKGAFEAGSGNLNGGSMVTQSFTVTGSYNYYYTLQDSGSSTDYFDISFGNSEGSGSTAHNWSTKAVYSSWRNRLLWTADEKFKFEDVSGSDAGTERDAIYVMSLKTAKLQDGVSPQFTVTLVGGAQHDSATAETVQSRSFTTFDDIVFPSKAGNYYRVVSGSAGTVHTTGNSYATPGDGGGLCRGIPTYGHFYPELGTIIWDASKLSASLCGPTASLELNAVYNNLAGGEEVMSGLAYSTAQADRFEAFKFAKALQSGSVQMRTYQYLNQTTYYCRMYHNEYNWTSNNTIQVSGSTTGEIREEFQTNPVTYVTEIGLYNGSGDLIAVAGVSKPVQKTKQTEATFAIKIDG